MNHTAFALTLSLSLGAWSCQSQNQSTTQDAAQIDVTSLTCICGEPAADLYGCHFGPCAEGIGNPDNALCACGALYATGSKTTSVSYGGTAASRELGRPQSISLKDGSIVRGVLRADDELSITLELSNGAKQTIAYADLAPRSIYRLMKARVTKDDGPGLIELGNYTRDNGLYAYSKRHYQEALAADPELRPQLEDEVAKLREIAGDDLLARAQAALQEGDEKEAERQLSRILSELPNEPAAETAHTLLGDLAAQAESRRIADETRPSTDANAVEEELAPARGRYDRAVEENRKGMLASAGSSKATKHYEKAVSEGDRGRELLEKSTRKNAALAGFEEAARGLDAQLVGVMVSANLNLAGQSMARSSFNKALNQVNQALLLDPSSSEARSMKSRIESAAADSGWGNGWGGWYLGTGGGARARAF
ncbi:MAG: hypothetical protein H6831_14210 [Planctomycetes bacterium]|nr:hypothetical protein [Planctomycetota bacterium]MCB9905555.1 hypothetical protein [Planctomycetota bacterium]